MGRTVAGRQHGSNFRQDLIRAEPHVLRHVAQDDIPVDGRGVVAVPVPEHILPFGVERKAVNLHDEETIQQEVHPANPGQEDLRLVSDPVAPEQVLRIDFNNGFGPQVEFPKCPERCAGAVCPQFAGQQFRGYTVQADCRRRHRGGRRRREASQRMQGYIFHCGYRHERMPVEPDCAVADEAAAMAMVAGQVEP